MASALQVIQIPTQPDFIDFSNGEPALSLLPVDLMQQAVETTFSDNDPAILQYGTEQGNGYFRRALAEFLTKGYRFPVDPATLFVTNGASMGLHLVCSLFTRPGDVVFVEEPTYFLAFHIFADHGLQVISLQTDENGLVIESLAAMLKSHHPKFVYVIPTFQNPTGRTLPEERREKLAALSREHDFLVAADEVYHFLNYRRQSPKPLAAYFREGQIISINSFSKILAPGLRLGWIQTDEERIEHFIKYSLLDSGGGMNPFTSAVVRHVIESGGLAKNIERLKAEYASRVSEMDKDLRQFLPMAEYVSPLGGYFFWLRLPGVDTLDFLRTSHSFNVSFHTGRRFSGQNGLKEYIRLSYVNYPVPEIEKGIIRLSQSLAEWNTNHPRH